VPARKNFKKVQMNLPEKGQMNALKKLYRFFADMQRKGFNLP
jgi:hypothetical protein